MHGSRNLRLMNQDDVPGGHLGDGLPKSLLFMLLNQNTELGGSDCAPVNTRKNFHLYSCKRSSEEF